MENLAKESLAKNLKSYVNFSDEELDSIVGVFKLKQFKKKEILAQKGKIVDSAFYIYI